MKCHPPQNFGGGSFWSFSVIKQEEKNLIPEMGYIPIFPTEKHFDWIFKVNHSKSCDFIRFTKFHTVQSFRRLFILWGISEEESSHFMDISNVHHGSHWGASKQNTSLQQWFRWNMKETSFWSELLKKYPIRMISRYEVSKHYWSHKQSTAKSTDLRGKWWKQLFQMK